MTTTHDSDTVARLAAFGIAPGSFAEHCANTMTIEELISALAESDADAADLKAWNLKPAQWRQQLAQALRHNLCFEVINLANIVRRGRPTLVK